MMIVKTAELNELGNYEFVVIFCRYQDKWLYCRAKGRDTFETAGGHIEAGEDPIDAARRELYEETGATRYEIRPVFDYSVQHPSHYTTGQVYIAYIKKLEELSDFEMEEVKLFDSYPEQLRFPEILPLLYTRLQQWLNLHSAEEEIWDVYDLERNLTGRTHRRIDALAEGDYHLVVFIWLRNSKGEYLISKRAPNKGYPNMWENSGGSAVAGDDSLSAAIREVKEELGLDVNPEKGKMIFTAIREDSFFDVWLFEQDFDLKDIVLQENETVDAKYASIDEIQRMIDNNEFISIIHSLEFLQSQ